MASGPWVSTSHAAGKLALGLWVHWVPGAKDVLRRAILDWAEKAKVEIQVDFIDAPNLGVARYRYPFVAPAVRPAM